MHGTFSSVSPIRTRHTRWVACDDPGCETCIRFTQERRKVRWDWRSVQVLIGSYTLAVSGPHAAAYAKALGASDLGAGIVHAACVLVAGLGYMKILARANTVGGALDALRVKYKIVTGREP